MGGGGQTSSSTSTQQFSPEDEAFKRLRASFASGQIPYLEELYGGLRTGNPLSLLPFTRGMIAPIEQQTQQAKERILRTMPAGGAQSYALGQANVQGAMQRGQLESELSKNLLQSLIQMISGYQAQSTGQTQRTSQSGAGTQLGFSAGPLSFGTTI